MPALPVVSFKEFVKNPIVALLFICLMAIGYLYADFSFRKRHRTVRG